MLNDNFYIKKKGFCESEFRESNIEYFNSASSLVLSLFGYLGIYQDDNSFHDNFIYSYLFTCGICSFLYHLYKLKGQQYLDRLSMIMPMSYGNLLIYNFYFEKLTENNNSRKLYNLIFSSGITIPLVLTQFTKKFRFVILVLTVLSGGFFFIIADYRSNFLNNSAKLNCIDNIVDCFRNGVLWVIISAGCWYLSESSCHDKKIKIKNETLKKIAGIYFHGLWHIFSGYGFYQLTFALKVIYLFRDNHENQEIINKINNSLKKTIPRY